MQNSGGHPTFVAGIYVYQASSNAYIYNNTVYNSYFGIRQQYSGTPTIKNNISYNNSSGDYSGSFNSTSTNNLSKDTTASTTYGTYYISKTLSFVSTTTGSEDLHLVSDDTDAIDKGVNLSSIITDDIDGEIRPAIGFWNIGADESDFISPIISSGSPTGTISGGISTTTLSLSTDEVATCKFATTTGVVYASMANTFTNTASTTHSTIVSGLTNGSTYNYYVRCIDASNNPNTSDYEIGFSVAATVTHTITSSAGANGTISPLGITTVNDGDSQIFDITPGSGIAVATLSIDGSTTSTSTTYTFTNVTADHTIAVTFADITPPSTPAGFIASTTSSHQIDLLWSTSTDNVLVTGYNIYRDGSLISTTTNVSYSDIAVEASTTYSYAIAAYDSAGNNSAQSESLSTTTLSILPHPRIILSNQKLAELRQKACYDNNGNTVPACTPTAQWQAFINWISPYRLSGEGYNMKPWQFAFAYMITSDIAYSNRAISLLDTEISDGLYDERYNQYLYVYGYMQSAAEVYDWLYPNLDSAHKITYRNYINQLLTELWNPTDNPYNIWAGWGINDGTNNYFYHDLLGTVYAGLALKDDNPTPPPLSVGGVSYPDIMSFVYAKINQQAIPSLTSQGLGGGWSEGIYGKVTKELMFEMFYTLKESGETNYFTGLDFPRESLMYFLYDVQPGVTRLYPAGDAPNHSTSVNGSDRLEILFLANGIRGTTEGDYAQYLLNNFSSLGSPYNYNYSWEFLMYDSVSQGTNFNGLPLTYYAPGIDWINSRSGWDTDAVSVSFTSTERRQGHQHKDQNSFVIYKNGWQATDASEESYTGLPYETYAHNTYLVDGQGQRYQVDNYGVKIGDSTGQITKNDIGSGYAYFLGDASDAYYNNPGGYGVGGPTLLDAFTREIVHFSSSTNYVVVYDRLIPVNASSTLTYLLQSKNQPTIDGSLVTSTNGDGKLFQRTLLPSQANIIAVDQNLEHSDLYSWCTELTYQHTQVESHFLNILYPTSSSTTSMPDTSLIDSTNMEGTLILDPVSPRIALFSKDGTPQSSVIYIASYSGALTGKHLLTNMATGTYDVYKNGTKIISDVSASSQGTLSFDSVGGSTFNVMQSSEAPVTHTVTSSAGSHGSISPNGTTAVNDGASQTYTITPDSGYSIATLTIDSSQIATSTSYTFTNITADHTIAATFAAISNSVTARRRNSTSASAVSNVSTPTQTTPTTATASTSTPSQTPITTTPVSTVSIATTTQQITGTSETPAVLFARNLYFGATGLDVTALQNILISQGYLTEGNNTGYFGYLTQTALVKYQKANSITPASGYFGSITRASLSTSTEINQSTDTGKLTKVLVYGMRDSEVSILQQILSKLPNIYPSGTVSGYFGNLTLQAVKKFQLQYNIVSKPTDTGYGVVGPATRGRLNDIGHL